MKNISKLIPVLFLFTLSTAAFAKDASFQELICEIEGKWAQRENSIFRASLKTNFSDNYLNIAEYVEDLQVKSRVIVNKNCLKGKDYRAVAPEIKKIWNEGCGVIVNEPLRLTCLKFMPLNDGSNIEKMIQDNPALAELIKRAKEAGPIALKDCSPGVSSDSFGKEQGIKDLQKSKEDLESVSKQ